MDIKSFNEYCGVGVVVTPEQIKQTVQDVINEKKCEILEKRYKFPVGSLLGKLVQKFFVWIFLIKVVKVSWENE